jgi:ATP synthase protein I
MLRRMGKPIRTVLRWQLFATALVASVSGVVVGVHGVLSAVLGGLIGVVSGLAASASASRVKANTAGWVLFNALKAEGVRVGLMVVLLWAVFANYRNVQVASLLSAFVISAVIFPMALFVRDRS